MFRGEATSILTQGDNDGRPIGRTADTVDLGAVDHLNQGR